MVAALLLLIGCASATGMRMPLDYSTEAAAEKTQARLDVELTPEQQWQFYQAVAFLAVRAIMEVAPKNLNNLYQALISGGADTLFSQGETQANFGIGDDGRALMQKCFGGKTPQQVVDEATKAGAFQNGNAAQVMQMFIQQAAQMGGK